MEQHPTRPTHLHLVHSVPEIRRNWMFTATDMVQLAAWSARRAEHGYRRSCVEGGNGVQEETGTFILLYAPNQSWAVWGLARAGNAIVVWHCATGSDKACFPSMADALDSLPDADAPAATDADPKHGSRKRERIQPLTLAFV